MASKYTYGSAGLMAFVALSQAVAGDWLTALMTAGALGAGAVGYTQDKTMIGKALRRLR